MLDAHIFYKQSVKQDLKGQIIQNITNINLDIQQDKYALATIHRAENTDDRNRLASIMEALSELPFHVILPLHPRTQRKLEECNCRLRENIHFITPVGYLEMMVLELNAHCIITDSGGVQKEAFFAQRPCVTLRESTEWIETIESGWNVLVGYDKNKIIEAASSPHMPKIHPHFYGYGDSGRKILDILAGSSMEV